MTSRENLLTPSDSWVARSAEILLDYAAVPKRTIEHVETEPSLQPQETITAEELPNPITPKLTFEYGPTCFRGLTMRRKMKISPFGETFKKKYPGIGVTYEPTDCYDKLTVRLQGSVAAECNISNLTYPANDVSQHPIYKLTERAIQRLHDYPDVMTKPHKDRICLMTHNLDIDYDVPWYRLSPYYLKDVDESEPGEPDSPEDEIYGELIEMDGEGVPYLLLKQSEAVEDEHNFEAEHDEYDKYLDQKSHQGENDEVEHDNRTYDIVSEVADSEKTDLSAEENLSTATSAQASSEGEENSIGND